MQLKWKWLDGWIERIKDLFAPKVDPVKPPTQGCTCDLGKALIRELRVDGHRNDHEGNRFWRLLNRCSDGQWQCIEPLPCTKEEAGGVRCTCMPEAGWHLLEYNDGPEASNPYTQVKSGALIMPKSGCILRIHYERRQI